MEEHKKRRWSRRGLRTETNSNSKYMISVLLLMTSLGEFSHADDDHDYPELS
jgi:hypothetical protein